MQQSLRRTGKHLTKGHQHLDGQFPLPLLQRGNHLRGAPDLLRKLYLSHTLDISPMAADVQAQTGAVDTDHPHYFFFLQTRYVFVAILAHFLYIIKYDCKLFLAKRYREGAALCKLSDMIKPLAQTSADCATPRK